MVFLSFGFWVWLSVGVTGTSLLRNYVQVRFSAARLIEARISVRSEASRADWAEANA